MLMSLHFSPLFMLNLTNELDENVFSPNNTDYLLVQFRDVIVYREIIISPMVQVCTRYRALQSLPDIRGLVTTLVKTKIRGCT